LGTILAPTPKLGVEGLGWMVHSVDVDKAKEDVMHVFGSDPKMVRWGFVVAVLVLCGIGSAQVLPPEDYLGKPIGADGVLADYAEMVAYFAYLDSVSDWIDVVTIGKSTLGNELIMAIATSPEVAAEIQTHRSIARKLRDARISLSEAERYASQGKVILLDMCAIHSDEAASTQMALRLAYRIASGDSAVTRYLDDVILLLIPCVNPDGHQMICDWYEKWKGTEHDGCWMPWLYHPYAGHDNNRDWYMFNLAETRLVSKVMYDTWLPQIILDHHEMWMTGARFFVPPYSDPVNPNIHPLVWRQIEVVGAEIRLNMQEEGLKGILSNALFPAWWEGASVMTPLWHNVVSLLTEAATVRIASPVYVDPSELGAGGTGFPQYTRLTNFPDPWDGGWWHLGDIMDYEEASLVGALEAASKHRKEMLLNFYRMCRDGVDRGKEEPPFAYLIPPGSDRFTTCRMLERLMLGGVEIDLAVGSFTADERTYPESTYIIYLSQPYRSYVKDMLECHRYPLIKLLPEASPLEPYDATTWTLPLKMDVRADEIRKPFNARTERCITIGYPQSIVPDEGRFLAVDRTTLSSYIFVNRAFDHSLRVSTLTDSLKTLSDTLLPGTIIVDLGQHAARQRALVRHLAESLGLDFKVLNSKPSCVEDLKRARIGVYQAYFPREPEGWLRYVLDDFGYRYEILHNEDMKRASVLNRFDAIILPSIQPSLIKQGKPSGRWAEFYEPPPPPYEGGIGDEGVKALREFVTSGGTIIAIGPTCDLLIEEFKLPAKDLLKDSDGGDFNCPGAILRLEIDPLSPICYGMKPVTPCFFFYSKVFSTRIPFGKFNRRVVARFPDEDLLLSGWLQGEDRIKGKAAVVHITYDKGDIILAGFDPVHRAQTYSTYRILLNSLLLAGGRTRGHQVHQIQ